MSYIGRVVVVVIEGSSRVGDEWNACSDAEEACTRETLVAPVGH